LTYKNAPSTAELYHNLHGISCGHATGRYEHSPPRERPDAVYIPRVPRYDAFYTRPIVVAGPPAPQPAPQPDVEAALRKLAKEKDEQMERMLATLEADTSAQAGELRELLDYRSNKIQLLEAEIERLKSNQTEVDVLNQQIRLLERRLEDSQKQTDLRQITVDELELKLRLAEEWATATRNSCVNENELEERVRLARAEEQAVADQRVNSMCSIKDKEIERCILTGEEKLIVCEEKARKAMESWRQAARSTGLEIKNPVDGDATQALNQYLNTVESETLEVCLQKRDAAVCEAYALENQPEPTVTELVEEAVENAVEEVEDEGVGLFDDDDGPPQKTRSEMYQNLIEAFDKLDEEGAEMAPRLDLRQSVDTFIPECVDVQELSDTVRNLDAMIVERDEYVELVDAWKDAQ